MIKAVICDLDETLLKSDKTVSQEDMETIKNLKEKGIYFIPATGRPFYSILHNLENLNLMNKEDISISYNGGMIHSNHKQEILSASVLDHDIVDYLFQFGQKEKVTMHIYVEHETYTYNLNDDERKHCLNFPKFYERHDKNIDHLKDTAIMKILFQNLDLEYLQSLEAQIPQDLKDHLEISYSSNRYLEFNPTGVSKGKAINFVADKLGISIDEILTIGDNNNDLSMILESGHSGAPANAVEEIKKAANYISDRTYNQSAVSDVVNYFIK